MKVSVANATRNFMEMVNIALKKVGTVIYSFLKRLDVAKLPNFSGKLLYQQLTTTRISFLD